MYQTLVEALSRTHGDRVIAPNPEEARLRICMLAACPFPANHGTPGSIREMAEAIADRGHDVHVVTYHFGEEIPVCGPTVHRIPALLRESATVVGPTARRPLYDLQMVFTALRVIREHHIDLIHAHGYEAALVAWLCRAATGVPTVYSAHCTMGDELASYNFLPGWLATPLARLLDAWVPRLADRRIPHSANIERFFRRMGLHARTEPVIYKGINLDCFSGLDGSAVRERYGLGDGPVVLYVGVMNEFQRLDLLVEAMAVVLREQPRARLFLVATIPSEKHLARVRGRAEQLGIAGRVVITEPQPLAAVPQFLAAGDVAVVPRPQSPGFPIKVLNYLAARTPCVLFASSSGGLSHRDNAFLVTPDTSDALADGILEVLRDHELRQRLAENGYRYVHEHRNRALTAQQVCAAYRRTLESCGRAGRLGGRAAVSLPAAAAAAGRGTAPAGESTLTGVSAAGEPVPTAPGL